MLDIYFDDILIDEDHYKSLSNEFNLFADTFRLGSTTSNSFKLEVPIVDYDIPEKITIKLDGNEYANVVIDKVDIVNEKYYAFTLTDNMTTFSKPYDASEIMPCTKFDLLQNICDTFGIELATSNFINKDDIVDWWDNRVHARTYIDYISECACGFAQIGQDGKLYIKKFTDRPEYTINIDTCENFRIGDFHIIERVVFDNGLIKYETDSNEELETLYLNPQNVFINTEETFNNIATEILGFNYYCFEAGKCEINPNVIAGDKLVFTDGINNYNTIAQYKLSFMGQWLGGYSLKLKSKREQETRIIDNAEEVKNLQVDLNRVENTLTIMAEDISNNNGQINELILNSQGTQNIIQQIGGVNNLSNTKWYQNLYDWLQEDGTTFEIIDNTDTQNNTQSKRELHIINGQISQQFNQLANNEYTITFQYRKDTNSYCNVRLYWNDTDYLEVLATDLPSLTRQTISWNYNALSINPTIVIYGEIYIVDLVINDGISTVWSLNNNESAGINSLFNLDGLKINDVNDENIYTLRNQNSTKVFSGGSLIAEYGQDSTTNNLTVNKITNGKLVQIGNQFFYTGGD